MTPEQFEQEVKRLRADVEWIKTELLRIRRDRPDPRELSPYDLNSHKLRSLERVKR
jgi:hypothetical protein